MKEKPKRIFISYFQLNTIDIESVNLKIIEFCLPVYKKISIISEIEDDFKFWKSLITRTVKIP